MDLVSELKGDLCVVTNALAKIHEDGEVNGEDISDEEKQARRNSQIHIVDQILNDVNNLKVSCNLESN